MLFLFDCVTLIILLNLTFLEYNLVRYHALLSFADGEYICGASFLLDESAEPSLQCYLPLC